VDCERLKSSRDPYQLIALETCQLEVVQYTSRRLNLADGKEASFLEGEYSPELQITLNSTTRASAQRKEIAVRIAAPSVKVGTENFDPIRAAAARGVEFSVSSHWGYIQKVVTPGRIFEHGHAALSDGSGTVLGGVGFYCALPHSYVDIFVHKPGGRISDYYWGDATLRTSVKFNGVGMPAAVEHGIIYIDIGDGVRSALENAFELKSGVTVRRSNVDVANFAKFDLLVRTTEPPRPSPDTDIVSYARMTEMCDETIAAQR
jgi:hypothetical protein